MQNEIGVIIGRKGSGKTTLAKTYILAAKKKRGRIIIVDSLGEYDGVHIIQLSELEKVLKNPYFMVRIIPQDPQDVDIIIALAMRAKKCLVVIDEAGLWQNPAYLPPVMLEGLRLGRHYQLDLLLIARRPTELNRMATAMSDTLYIFGTHEPRDLEYIRSIDADLPDIVKALPRYHYIAYSTDGTYGAPQVTTRQGRLT